MAINDYGVRFTEEKYATKNEVARELKMSMVDPIWSPVLKYRSNYNRYLTIKSIDHKAYTVCLCITVSSLANNVETKLSRLMNEYNKLGSRVETFKKSQLAVSLKSLNTLAGLGLSDSAVNEFANGFVRNLTDADKKVINYIDALKFIERRSVNPVNEDYLAELYAKLKGTNELTAFYRLSNSNSAENRVLIDRLYVSAPADAIAPMMASLYELIEKSNIGSVTKALVSYYYVNYIKPFNDNNTEMAILTLKSILAHDSIGELAGYLPLERIATENINELTRLCNEVQKTNDLTYFLVYAYSFLDKMIQDLLDQMIDLSREEIKNDFYQLDEQTSEEVKETTKVEVEETPKVEVVDETVSKPRPTPKVKVAFKENEQGELAVKYIPYEIDEKEAHRLEVHLLECDPLLKKGQAKFYARHCTLGKLYTIAQYKKAIGCVYETARTSMDSLAELGYYRKQQVKNKFVYTPVERK